jgi:hypothetical protein
MGRHVIGSTAEELRMLREDMHRMLKAGGDPPSGKWADLALLEPARDLKGDVTLTGNTVMYSSRKNPAPRKISDLGCANVSFGSHWQHYTHLT